MASTKTVTVIHNNLALTVAGGVITSDAWDLADGYGGMLHIKITNGGTAPTTTGAQSQVQLSPDNSNYYNYGGALVAGITNSAVYSWDVEIPIGVKYVKTVSTPGNDQTVTLRVEGTEVTAIS